MSSRRPTLLLVVLTCLCLSGVADAQATSEWTSKALPSSVPKASIYGISADGPTDAWVVGQNESTGYQVAFQWNGASWSDQSPPAQAATTLFGVAAVSPTNVWAVGQTALTYKMTIEHWNGKTWKNLRTPGPEGGAWDLFSVAAVPGTNTLWATGTTGRQALVVFCDGTHWKAAKLPGTSGGDLESVVARSATDVWAVGPIYGAKSPGGVAPLIEHWNGATWTRVTGVSVRGGELTGITAVPGTDQLWAVGDIFNDTTETNKTFAEQYANGTWTRAKLPSLTYDASFNAAAAVSQTDVWAVGYASTEASDNQTAPLTEHWNGATWKRVAAPTGGTDNDNPLTGATVVPGTEDVWADGISRDPGPGVPFMLFH